MKLFLRIALVLGVLTLGLALCEFGLRAVGAFTPNPPLYLGDREVTQRGWADPDLGWTMPKSSKLDSHGGEVSVAYTTNSQGFRASDDFRASSKEVHVAFVGDSFTFGVGVADAQVFPALVESSLTGVRAQNFGVSGFGVDQMELALSKRVLPLAPDLVVVTFVEDDLNRCLTAYRERGGWSEKPTFVLDGDRLRPMTLADRPSAWRRWLEEESRCFEIWRRAENALSLSHPIGYRWRLNRALFTAMRDACASAHVPLVVMHIPERGKWSAAATYAREFEALGIAFLDLGATHPASSDALYLAKDPHLNPDGHRFVCAELVRFLGAKGELARLSKLAAERGSTSGDH